MADLALKVRGVNAEVLHNLNYRSSQYQGLTVDIEKVNVTISQPATSGKNVKQTTEIHKQNTRCAQTSTDDSSNPVNKR